jgi:hypothetical protein
MSESHRIVLSRLRDGWIDGWHNSRTGLHIDGFTHALRFRMHAGAVIGLRITVQKGRRKIRLGRGE